jgi:hypothetical protein
MALHSVPLLAPTGPRSPSGGPDVYAAEFHHVQSPRKGGEAEGFRGVAVLVSFSKAAADRMALWPLRDALAFGTCTHIDGTEWPQWLAERVAATKPTFVTAVLLDGADADLVAETVQSAIDVLYQQFGSTLAAVVVVSATTERLAMLRGVTGFVRGVEATNGDTARQIFLALSTLQASEALGGIDLLDLLPAFGTAVAPSVMAQALWFRERDGSLVYPTDGDRHAVANARRVVAVPLIRGWGWDELRRFHGAVRQDATACRSPVVFATNNALLPGLLPSNVGWVPILCANH